MEERETERWSMVLDQIAARGISDRALLEAVGRVPRHLFLPEAIRGEAYDDTPLPIEAGQRISQPYLAAAMLDLSRITAGEGAVGRRLLEIGTGSGYSAALAAELGAEVWTLECREELAYQARARLMRLGYGAVRVRRSDGRLGWPEAAPYDAILCSAAAETPPLALLAQLAPDARLVIPLGPPSGQYLCTVTIGPSGPEILQGEPVRFGMLDAP